MPAVATDESSYVVGHDLLVDGGLSRAYVVSVPLVFERVVVDAVELADALCISFLVSHPRAARLIDGRRGGSVASSKESCLNMLSPLSRLVLLKHTWVGLQCNSSAEFEN